MGAVARGVAALFWSNLKHYSRALWGIHLQLDPDYSIESRVLPHLIADSVLEYRGYLLLLLWGAVLSHFWFNWWGYLTWFPPAYWAVDSWNRAGHFRSRFHFWKQAYRETPNKTRVMTHYAEELINEQERRDKGNIPYEEIEQEARRVIERICGK